MRCGIRTGSVMLFQCVATMRGAALRIFPQAILPPSVAALAAVTGSMAQAMLKQDDAYDVTLSTWRIGMA